jgi:hypothetical protein
MLFAQLLDLVLREVAEAQPLRDDARARKRRERAADRFQERGLARAVRPEKPDAVAREETPREPFQYGCACRVAERCVLEQHQLPRGPRHRRERELERAVDVRRGDLLHPLEGLDPALRLLGLARLGAEAVDERMQVRDLALLRSKRRLLQRELQRPLALELRVVPGVRHELALVDVHDAVDHAVEEIAVVGDEEQRAGVFAEPVLEPQHRVQVEVIGRLVEQQEIGAAHERLREVEPHAPPPGKGRHRVAVARFHESESRKECGRARSRAVAADVFEPVVQVRDQRAVVRRVCFRSRKPRFDLAQLPVAVEHVVERARIHRRRLLRDVRDGPCGRKIDAAGVGDELAPDRGEEARLARSVGADEADLVAGVHGQAGAFEQALGAAGEREIDDAEHHFNW